MKQNIPWPIKFSIKLLLGLTPLDYRWLKRSGLVELGKMEEAGFAREIFKFHVQDPSAALRCRAAGTLLELGPGDSVASGILGREAGFSAVDLVDAGRFADMRPASIDRLLVSLGAEPSGLASGASPEEVLAWLRGQGIRYMSGGVRSLASIDTAAIGYSFSNTVLQHVYRDDLPHLVGELGRVHAPGTFGSHSVNFTDHFSGGFVNRRLPDWFMESGWVKRAHLYTNRVPPEALLGLFEAAGLQMHQASVDFHGAPGCAPVVVRSAADLHGAVAERPVLRVVYIVHKVRQS